jgi:hypothetical protein
MKERALKKVNNCWNTNISFYFETSGGQSYNLYLNIVNFSTPVLISHLWQLKTVVFLHRCLIHADLLMDIILSIIRRLFFTTILVDHIIIKLPTLVTLMVYWLQKLFYSTSTNGTALCCTKMGR